MKSFMEYLLESSFSNIDFTKHDYQYLTAVLNDIANTGKVSIGENPGGLKEITVDQNIRKEFSRYLDTPNLLDVNEFNKLAKSNSTKFIWGNIYKGKYSGQEHQSAGEYAESAVAYVFNVMNGNKQITEADDDKYAEITKVLMDKKITSDWIKSSRLSAEKIHKEISNPKRYIAAHVDGKDISRIPETILKVAKIFKGKPGIREVVGSGITKEAVDGLYSTGKDTWNKADIVLVDTKLDIDKELEGKFFKVSDEFNMFLNGLINTGKIMPISLKKIKPKATLDQIKFEKEGKLDQIEKTQTEVDNIKDVDIVLPLSVNPEEKYVATCYLKTNNKLQIDFRHGTAQRESLNIELKLKTARGGKAMAELKRMLKLESGFYKHESFKDEKDFVNQIKKLTGIKLTVPPKLHNADKWYIRPAFKGLVSLLKIYHTNVEKNLTPQVDLVEFFKLLYNCASGANSESIFWLLTMK